MTEGLGIGTTGGSTRKIWIGTDIYLPFSLLHLSRPVVEYMAVNLANLTHLLFVYLVVGGAVSSKYVVYGG